MEFIADIIGWVTANWKDFGALYLQLIGTASIVVKLTPTLKDDDALKWVVKFMGKYVALNRGSGTPNA